MQRPVSLFGKYQHIDLADMEINEYELYGKYFSELTSEDITKLVNDGADLNEIDSKGYTPFLYSIMYSNNKDVVKAYIDLGADVNASWEIPSENGEVTPLMLSAKYNTDKAIIELLVSHGANPHYKNSEEDNALAFVLHYSESLDVLEYILSLNTRLSKAKLEKTNWYTKVIVALELFKIPISHAMASVTYALFSSKSEAIIKGVLLPIQDDSSKTNIIRYSFNCIMLLPALENPHDIALNLLIDNIKIMSLSELAPEHKNKIDRAILSYIDNAWNEINNIQFVDQADTLQNRMKNISSIIDINATDKDGNTIIHTAILMAFKILTRVASNGPETFDFNNVNILAGDDGIKKVDANMYLKAEVLLASILGAKLEILVNAGTDINRQNNMGNTPLHLAVQNYVSNALIDDMLKLGADKQIANDDNITPRNIPSDYAAFKQDGYIQGDEESKNRYIIMRLHRDHVWEYLDTMTESEKKKISKENNKYFRWGVAIFLIGSVLTLTISLWLLFVGFSEDGNPGTGALTLLIGAILTIYYSIKFLFK